MTEKEKRQIKKAMLENASPSSRRFIKEFYDWKGCTINNLQVLIKRIDNQRGVK
jgi:hypothetical protein